MIKEKNFVILGIVLYVLLLINIYIGFTYHNYYSIIVYGVIVFLMLVISYICLLKFEKKGGEIVIEL